MENKLAHSTFEEPHNIKHKDEKEFRDACLSGDIDTISMVTECLDDVQLDYILNNSKGHPNGTPLFEAAVWGKMSIIRHLIELESDLEVECSVNVFFPIVYRDAGPVLCLAAASGSVLIVEMLLNAAADPNHASLYATPLTNACRYGYDAIVSLLLERGACPNARLSNGKSALHLAGGSCDDIMLLRLLLAYGSDINALDSAGKTPLFYACLKGNCDMGELLLQHDDNRLSPSEKLEHLWLLGASCVNGESWEEALRYWRWAAADEACHEHYRGMVHGTLTVDQFNSHLQSRGFTLSDLETMSRDNVKLRLHALVLLSLVLPSNDALMLSVFSDLVMDLVSGHMSPYLVQLSQLITFGGGIVEKFTRLTNLWEFLNALVDMFLNAFETGKLDLLDRGDVGPSLLSLLRQLVVLFSSMSCLSTLDYGDTMTNVHVPQLPSLSDTLHDIIVCTLAMTRLAYIFSPLNETTLSRALREILHPFVTSVVKRHLDPVVWSVLIDAQYCRHAVIWIYDLLFPDVKLITMLFVAGLDVNAVDKFKRNPLHLFLMSKSRNTDVLRTFLDCGTSVDLPDVNGVRPCDIMSHKDFPCVDLLQYRGLKSLAAEVIIRCNVPYSSLPRPLYDYVHKRYD